MVVGDIRHQHASSPITGRTYAVAFGGAGQNRARPEPDRVGGWCRRRVALRRLSETVGR